ncbi:exocyst complex component SEC3A [Pyrus ussuriensis x Pyrus communis]|uniref:RBR-type E3 ubiquitin transferase n=1 Tax=Pyrus ussuriensis x Pyrus communis TaxID=2448454 RepID=A0A5N5GX77_9ROSA|nr:exocyst complex component SEC3A [Pyrus ussuriensis x Pyrus communis]
MAKSSADDQELRRACEAAIEGTKQSVVMSIRVAKSRGIWGKTHKLGRDMAKPRVLALSVKTKGQRTQAFLRVLKYSTGGVLEPAKLYKLKHLSKVEVLTNDPSGCTFTLGFDNLRSQSVAPPQWTMRNIDDRNRLLLCILNICKDALGHLPKVVGIDVVEMALWAKENTPAVTSQGKEQEGPAASTVTESDLKVTVEKELVSQAEEEDMEALLGTYVMGIGEAEAFSERLKRELLALEAANVHAILESEPLIDEVLQGLEAATNCVDDMDEWLGIFNVKLRHMREDIESIETRNNKLEMQSVNNRALIYELDKLLLGLRVPSQYAACLTGGSFDEARMLQNIEACEWLAGALRSLEVPNLDPIYANMRAVKEKRAELEKLKSTFVRRASEFLRNYFASLVDFMISDKSYFSQRGQLKRPDHADLRYKCRTYARLLQHLKSLDKNCMGALRKAYCSSLNLLLRREAREFANELRASTKASRNPTVWLEASTGSGQNVNAADTSTVSEAYSKMLTIFIPLLVDESSFFAHFMCFEVPALVPPGGTANGDKYDDTNDDDLGIMDIDDNDSKAGKSSGELAALNESLQDLLDGIQEDFYAVVDWAYKIDPLRCISMHGITERYLSGQKADAAGFVRLLLGDLESRVSMQFSHFVDEACRQIERNERNVRQMGVLSYIPRFATLATRMEQYIQGQSRDLVDQAYTKFVSIMFATLEKIAQTEPKYSDLFLLENYAAFQNSLYDLANVVPTLAKFYHQASEAYEQACTRHISMIIYNQFERLFQFARRIEDLMYTIAPEEIPFQLGLSKMDLRKVIKSSLSGLDKSITAMYKKLQKNMTSEELLPSLWDKCKKEFLDKYESFAQLVAKIYPTETIHSSSLVNDQVNPQVRCTILQSLFFHGIVGAFLPVLALASNSSIMDSAHHSNSFLRDDQTASQQLHYTILKQADISQRQLHEITEVCSILCVSRAAAIILLRHCNWNTSKLFDKWFEEEDEVRKRLGLFKKTETSPLVQTSSSDVCSFTCEICFETFVGGDRGISSNFCGHFYCGGCWGGYVSKSINNDGLGCLSLKCPHPSCGAAVGEDMIFLLADIDSDKGKFSRYLVRSYIEESYRKTKIKWCPAPGCDNAVDFVGGNKTNCDVSCLCSYIFCWNCSEEAHSPVKCETVAKWMSKNKDESENMNWILVNTKPCPQCKRPIEKNQGCNHMRCRAPCRFDFCWICLGEWGRSHLCNSYLEGVKSNASEKRKEMAKMSLDRYVHHYERWIANHDSKQKALQDFRLVQDVHLKKLDKKYRQTNPILSFVTEAWQEIIQCRRVLQWSYAYGFYIPENEDGKRRFFEYLQGEAECGFRFCWLCLCEFKKCHCHSYNHGDFVAEDRGKKEAKKYLEKYIYYYERWVSSKKKAMEDFNRLQSDDISTISEIQCQSDLELKFIIEAWKQIIEGRQILRWSYAYGYYIPEDELLKLKLFDHLLRHAVFSLERLHQCAPTRVYLRESSIGKFP